LYFEFDCLSPIFVSATEKSFNFCFPQPKKSYPRLWVKLNLSKSSDVAVISDRTAYDVRCGIATYRYLK